MASVECASIEIEPYDIAPVTNRRTISFQGSTCSIGIEVAFSYRGDELPSSARSHYLRTRRKHTGSSGQHPGDQRLRTDR